MTAQGAQNHLLGSGTGIVGLARWPPGHLCPGHLAGGVGPVP